MATVQDIYNEIDRIENSKSGIAGAIEEKGVEVPAGAKIDEYPELVRQIQQGDTSDCVKFTPQTLSDEQKAQARDNIGAQETLVSGTNIKKFAGRNLLGSGDAVLYLTDVEDKYIVVDDSELNFILWHPAGQGFGVVQTGANARVWNYGGFIKHFCYTSDGFAIEVDSNFAYLTFLSGGWGGSPAIKTATEVTTDDDYTSMDSAIREMDYAVKYTSQSLTDAQKLQARTNIGATAPEVFVVAYGDTTVVSAVQTAVAAGKIVLCIDGTTSYVLTSNGSSYIYFTSVTLGTQISTLRLTVSDGSWVRGGATNLQPSSQKKTSVPDNRTSNDYYPTTKAVYDFSAKYGILSQTQTWSGTGSQPRTYVMSDKVWGAIPQANIDLFEAAGATFNSISGYFELNGLTDISYEEMQKIYAESFAFSVFKPDCSYAFYSHNTTSGLNIRTALTPRCNRASGTGMNISWCFYDSTFEALDFHGMWMNTLSQAFRSCQHVRAIVGLNISGLTASSTLSNAFLLCGSLETLELKGLKVSIDLSSSSVISKESLLYIINNETSTGAITITLNSSVYAKCQSGGDWYSDVSTALSNHTNVSLASA